MSLWVSRPHLYRSIIHLVNWVWVFGVTPISINHSFYLYQFEFWVLGLHLYWLVIHLFSFSLSFWGRTYIDQPFFCQFVFSLSWDRTYIDWSLSMLVWVQFEFLGQHLYQSVIHPVNLVQLEFWDYTYTNRSSSMSVWVWVFETTPISVGHLSCQFEFSLGFWNCTYIDWSFILLVWVFRTTTISISHSFCQFNMS